MTESLDYFSFRRSFETSLSRLKLPADCTIQEPTWEPIDPPLGWMVTVFFDFTGRMHIRLWENYDKFAGLQMSRRVSWSYHYGQTTVTDAAGRAMQGAANDPVDLRIDTCSGLHMHYQKQQPHLGQSDISGLALADITAFDFVRAVLRHRKTGKPLTKTFGFKIETK